MQIGELAATTGTTVRVLRHYEKQGLILARRRQNGYRDTFAPAQTFPLIVKKYRRAPLASELLLNTIFCSIVPGHTAK